jgi:hypothetical protein
MNPEVTELWRRSNEIQSAIEQWIQDHDGKHVPVRYKRADQIKLLKFRTWQLRYKLSIPEILNLIVWVLRTKMLGRGKGYGLGVSVRTLVGQGSERILQEEIAKFYPANEHIAMWRDQERERQIEAERNEDLDGMASTNGKVPTLMECDTVDKYIARYKKKILHSRQVHEVEVTKTSRRRKAYRGNPWL